MRDMREKLVSSMILLIAVTEMFGVALSPESGSDWNHLH
jgi:hypothetical protein